MSENMIFCLGSDNSDSEGDGYQKNYRIFNKDVSKDEYKKVLSSLSTVKILPTKWIDEKDMSTKELGGYLKTFFYEEAWANFWDTATKSQKDAILNIPQFDAEIFKGITGLDIKKQSSAELEAIEMLRKNGYKIVKE